MCCSEGCDHLSRPATVPKALHTFPLDRSPVEDLSRSALPLTFCLQSSHPHSLSFCLIHLPLQQRNADASTARFTEETMPFISNELPLNRLSDQTVLQVSPASCADLTGARALA